MFDLLLLLYLKCKERASPGVVDGIVTDSQMAWRVGKGGLTRLISL